MKDFQKVHIDGRVTLRQWLSENHTQEESIWLVLYKKHVPDKYTSWDDVVEEALCFGWIDSLPRKFDDDRFMLMLSPRRAGSIWSRLNKQRVEKLLNEGLMEPPGLAAIERAKEDGSWTIYDEIEDMIIPPDLKNAFDNNKKAKTNFEAFPDSSIKGILWWIKSAKKEETRQKRIAETVELAVHNIKANHPEARAFR